MGVELATGESGQPYPDDPGATSRTGVRRVAFGACEAWEPSIRTNLEPRYAADFISLDDADLEAFDAVAPLQIEHYQALARRPELFGRKFIHPTADVAALCDDKLELTRFLVANGFGAFTPALRAPGAPYPYVWKRRRGAWGCECHVITGPEAEARFDLADQDWFAQVLAPGPVEFATHVLRVNAELRYLSTITYGMAGPMLVRGQNHKPDSAQLGPGCPYPILFDRILSALDYAGTACFNYKIVDGKPLIFEINPRYGGSLSADITAYIDAYLAALSPDSPPRGSIHQR